MRGTYENVCVDGWVLLDADKVSKSYPLADGCKVTFNGAPAPEGWEPVKGDYVELSGQPATTAVVTGKRDEAGVPVAEEPVAEGEQPVAEDDESHPHRRHRKHH